MSTTEEARRLILRAANCPRSPRGLNGLTTSTFQPRGGMAASQALPPPLPPPPMPPMMSNHPHPSIGSSAGSSSSSGSSSGYSSMADQLLRVAPPSSSGSSSASISPTGPNTDPIIPSPHYANGFHERAIKVRFFGSGLNRIPGKFGNISDFALHYITFFVSSKFIFFILIWFFKTCFLLNLSDLL
jgi:hypothetical protein